MKPKVTVALISRNEEKAVGAVLTDIRRYCPEAEILLVDSSTDRTAAIAESFGARVIRQLPPKGYGPAMEMVLRNAQGDVVVTLDCDNTYPAEKIQEFADLVLAQGYDLIDGSRLERKPQAMPWINYFANYFFALLASILFGRRLTDLHSGMRAYRKSMIDAMIFVAKGSALPVELLLKPITQGYKVKVVFIDYRERIGVSTLDPLKSAWWTLKRILGVRFGKTAA